MMLECHMIPKASLGNWLLLSCRWKDRAMGFVCAAALARPET